MMWNPEGPATQIPPDARLALSLLSSYLFFLSRRPVSSSNAHYLSARLAGLKSLAGALDTGGPELADAAKRLRAIQPASFVTLNYSLQFQLSVLFRPPVIPAEYIILPDAPPRSFYSGVRRVLLILGPAIGIGDEIILFPLPERLKAAFGEVETVVMSGYAGLWDRVQGVAKVIRYSTHAEILDALRGRHEAGPFDAVIMADFEKPGLSAVMCADASIDRYIELSLGAQCAIAADNRERRVFCTSMPLDAAINYYAAVDRLTQWLGFPGTANDRYESTVDRERRVADGVFRIFVSPFTSKYEPSAVYWSHILASLLPERTQEPVEFVLDPGTNLETERFSRLLARSAAARAAQGVSFRVAHGSKARSLQLCEVFSELERCDAAICADSFLAHAAPQFDLTVMVIAKAGLENWRTPSSRSYYFYLERPVDEITAAMRMVLGATMSAARRAPFAEEPGARRLDAATRKLANVLGNGGFDSGHGLNGQLAEFLESYAGVVASLNNWPRECRGLWGDVAYENEWRREADGMRRPDREAWHHLRDRVARWEQTNLRKFLRLIHDPQEAAAGETV